MTFALEINEKFADQSLKKLRAWSLSLASTIPVFGHERVCPEDSVLGLRFFSSPWP